MSNVGGRGRAALRQQAHQHAYTSSPYAVMSPAAFAPVEYRGTLSAALNRYGNPRLDLEALCDSVLVIGL